MYFRAYCRQLSLLMILFSTTRSPVDFLEYKEHFNHRNYRKYAKEKPKNGEVQKTLYN